MKADIKEQWVAALRSGDYTQGNGALRYKNKYCCLGVLCDLHAKATDSTWLPATGMNSNDRYLDSVGSYLPKDVCDWAGIDGFPAGLKSYDVEIKHNKVNSLSAMNDREYPFAVIAKTIEEQL